MEQKIKFAPTVLLVDACYLDRVGRDMKAHFAPIVNRELPKADLAVLLECLALDAGIQPGESEIQVIFIYQANRPEMEFCSPGNLEKELHNVGFKSPVGEFSLYAFQPSGMAKREDLFSESLQLAGESKDVKRIIFIPDEGDYASALEEVIGEIKGKERITRFGMNPPDYPHSYAFELLGFSILQSFGIRSEELG